MITLTDTGKIYLDRYNFKMVMSERAFSDDIVMEPGERLFCPKMDYSELFRDSFVFTVPKSRKNAHSHQIKNRAFSRGQLMGQI